MSYSRLQKVESWNMGLGRFRLVFLVLKPLGLRDSHVPTCWLLLYAELMAFQMLEAASAASWASFMFFFIQRENFKLLWLPNLVLLSQFELSTPWWLENRVVAQMRPIHTSGVISRHSET